MVKKMTHYIGWIDGNWNDENVGEENKSLSFYSTYENIESDVSFFLCILYIINS